MDQNSLITSEQVLVIHGLSKAKLRKLTSAKVIVPHQLDPTDNRRYLYKKDCVEIRYKVSQFLSSRLNNRLNREQIGEIFVEEFGADDKLLIQNLESGKMLKTELIEKIKEKY